MNFNNYLLISLLAITIFSSTTIFNNNFSVRHDINKENNNTSPNFLQNLYAIEEDDDDEDNDKGEDEKKNFNHKKDKSVVNFVAVGDWDCTGETEDTVDNIIEQDPELVLALGDFSYSGDANCWFELIEPIADKTKIVLGNHEDEEDYMDFFGLKEQYYSFNYKNIHFLALSTETDYDDDSEQYQFAIRDLEKYSKDPFIEWIIVFYHRHIYGSGSLEEDTDFRDLSSSF